ncbi:signal transduction histidine kinase/DNA-binding response OmpR family regulator/CHASE3 domain sensor protein [Endobacter medicaginis]|uniref:histidine kinase n=4 Tax=Endobacter medicaginis TaxID=1181271 RepID=A0A839V3G0_9PROT|nr:response regulator [Endobacter medicaginis]MBB3174112.1 signal transduction histidine kinase/DNA-binding response OmpR family regulator/CHASE3 domain sensor protein [Endobacter medicaginis]MCX5474156.1 response regulator [Endobacter medicaginis]
MSSNSSAAQRLIRVADRWAAGGIIALALFFLFGAAITTMNVRVLRRDVAAVGHSHDVIVALDGLMSDMQDAETGQRGYLLLGEERYLIPYENAQSRAAPDLDRLARLIEGDPAQAEWLAMMRRHVEAKLAELRQTVELARGGDHAGALAAVRTDRGRVEMDAIRSELAAMSQSEAAQRLQRLDEMDSAYVRALASAVLLGVLGVAMTALVGLSLRRVARRRRAQQWQQGGLVALSGELLGEEGPASLGSRVAAALCDILDAKAAALFMADDASDGFVRIATSGVPADAAILQRFATGEGMLGRVAASRRTLVLDDVPDDFLVFGSAMGRHTPRHLLIAPIMADGVLQGVVELGFRTAPTPAVMEFMAEAGAAIAVALRTARFRAELSRLLSQAQRQTDELQVQGEELRVTNEELEEQGRALRESSARLEHQQAELEASNNQLSEQATQLEAQRDELERAKAAVEAKAAELQRASTYKSAFLANMSHELRTPLNSSLILSRLLAENPDGNLSAEQVRFAQTIEASGNDLLTLINDILDLSKIEAGHVELRLEPVALSRLAASLRAMFAPLAASKGLTFAIDIAADAPEVIETDRQRVEQVLRNLLANALKFTEAGGVSLAIAPAPGGGIAFAVTDSGIGIAPEQSQAIFEAFQQADGTISRRFGGTGLGLSISRELVRLLGGQISLRSTPGEGSVFTVTLPGAGASPSVAVPDGPSLSGPAIPEHPAAAPVPARAHVPLSVVEDDRARLSGQRRVLLVVEDDAGFATVLRDRARHMGFEVLVAGTAEDALNVAASLVPHAVVLDVGLPDQSGLAVLDRFKSDVRTRHIPVHVVSGADHAQTALSLGAVGYALKPVRPEELAAVFTGLERRLAPGTRRVLVVEDDPVQREAVSRLLAAPDVEIVGVGTAAECLDLLRADAQRFDCMVLDLALPDASGFSLLETLSGEGAYALPPVIVYTGRDLAADEEQRLRRYSKSIIIKGAKSPERLLDEVALFLHQVVAELPPQQQSMIRRARNRDAILEGRRILIVEDDIRNVFSLTNILEPRGAIVEIARNGVEAIEALERGHADAGKAIDLVLMDVMMPVMDGLTAMRRIREQPHWRKLPMIALTAKAMPDDQASCIEAGASDYIAKPLDVDRLLSLVRVWMPPA